ATLLGKAELPAWSCGSRLGSQHRITPMAIQLFFHAGLVLLIPLAFVQKDIGRMYGFSRR
ncbi:MAG: hypothetical protein WAN63_01675, partial [Candidatus Sulfotelmatobacter sp.]